MTNAVKLENLIRDNKIVYVVQGKQYIKDKEIIVSDIYRPGLELTGYFALSGLFSLMRTSSASI